MNNLQHSPIATQMVDSANTALQPLPVTHVVKLDQSKPLSGLVFYRLQVTVFCPKHGQVTFAVSRIQPTVDKVVCEQCQHEYDQAKLRCDFLVELNKNYEKVNIPTHFKTTRFSDYRLNNDPSVARRQYEIIEFMGEYAYKFLNSPIKNLPNILFVGGTGTGKTMLACSLVNEIFAQASNQMKTVDGASFVRSSDITQGAGFARQNNQSEADFIRSFATKSLLIIDDLGENDRNPNSEYAKRDRDRLSSIIDARYQKMPTIFTTNLPFDDPNVFENFMTFLGDRAFDRVQERLVVIRCNWESERQKKRMYLEF